MQIYVRSRGYHHDQDYPWHGFVPDGDTARVNEVPLRPPLPELRYILRELTDTESQRIVSVVLGRNMAAGELFLLVAGLAGSRRDFARRLIQPQFLWIGKEEEEEALRAIAVCALRNPAGLAQMAECGIEFDDKHRFRTKIYAQLVNFAESDLVKQSIAGVGSQELPEAERALKRARHSDDLRNRLADVLEQHRLPSAVKYPVVVTDLVSVPILEKAGIWRALSLSADIRSTDWEANRPQSRPRTVETDKKKRTRLASILASALILTAAIVIVILLLRAGRR